MFTVNEDMSIYATRGDVVCFSVMAYEGESPHTFKVGDVVRITITEKKDCESVCLQKDFPIEVETDTVIITLNEDDTRFGEVISKPTDYWYEIELNPHNAPQTIVGYDDDGAKIFKLFPEGDDVEYVPSEEVIKDIDDVLDVSSVRPVQNQAITRAMYGLIELVEKVQTENEQLATSFRENLSDTVAESVAEELSNTVSKSMVANNLTTSTDGYVLDARQGKVLSERTTLKGIQSSDSATIRRIGNFVQINLNGLSTYDFMITYLNGIKEECLPIDKVRTPIMISSDDGTIVGMVEITTDGSGGVYPMFTYGTLESSSLISADYLMYGTITYFMA